MANNIERFRESICASRPVLHWSVGLALSVGALLLSSGAAYAQRCSATLPPGAGVPESSSNPVISRVLGGRIIPVPMTDGLVHLAFASQVTNMAGAMAVVLSITPVDPLHNFDPTGNNLVLDVDTLPITGKVRAFGPKQGLTGDVNMLSSGGSGITFFDVTYPTLAQVPELVAQRISVRLPDGITLTTLTDPRRISCDAPVVIRPPLKGSGWWNGNGCCQTVNAHRGATLPINGDLKLPEQFAIDFMRVTTSGACCEGSVTDLKSWPFYGAPVVASAAGTIVEAVDDQPDQIPGPAKNVTVANAGGNHVIEDIGEGRWILYAHLKPGTVSVHASDKVETGQQLGEVGNSGSSTAPHLHFQVMNRPSMLNAMGLPFVFDRQTVEGVVQETAAQAEKEYETGKPLKIDRSKSEVREGEMPIEGQILGFGSE